MADYGKSKSLSRATSVKEEGNSYYKQGNLDTALKHFTQALFFAPYPSEIVDQTLQELVDSCDPFLRDYLQHDPTLTRVKRIEDSILAHCYGNRSATLYELKQYKECLVDIDRALTSGYPNTTVFKLYKRQALCLAHLGRSDEAISVIELCKSKVVCSSSKEKDTLQRKIQDVIKEIKRIKPNNIEEKKTKQEGDCCSSSICCEILPDKGRGLVAKKDLSFGDCVLSETPYIALLDKEYLYTHCSYCFKKSSIILPCPLCAHAGYCSMSCMQIAWRSYHWLECKNIDDWNKLYMNILKNALRMLLRSPRKDVQTVIKKCQSSSLDNAISELTSEDCTDISGIYQAVLKLESNSGQYADATMKLVFEMQSEKCIGFFKTALLKYYELKGSSLPSLTELFRYHMCQLRCNPYYVTENPITQRYIKVTGKNILKPTKVELGDALYLTASLFNHSCVPNTIISYVGTSLSAYVYTSSVKKGEELCYCYGAEVGRKKKAERQEKLKTYYYFDCTCIACHNPDKALIYREHTGDGLACLKCQGLLPLPETGRISQCLDCGHSTDVSHHLEVKHRTEQLFKEAYQLSYSMSSLSLYEKCLKEQARVLYKHNNDLVNTCDAIGFLYFYAKEDYKSAVPYLRQLCDGLEAVCGPYSRELMWELPKLIRALAFSGDKAGAIEMAHKALPLLKLFYGDNYKDIIDLSFLLAED